MIDSAQELVDKVARYYGSEKMTVEIEDGLKNWIRKTRLTPLEMESLYSLVIENCDHIPKVSLVKKLWNESGEKVSKGDSFGKGITVLHDNRDKSWQSIIDEMNVIRDEQVRRDLRCKEIDFLHEFQELMDVHKLLNTVPSLIMPQKDKDTYLRKVKEDIVNNVPINMDAVARHMARRCKEYEQQYGAEVEEHAPVMIGHTLEELQGVFNDTAKLFKPEPDRIMI